MSRGEVKRSIAKLLSLYRQKEGDSRRGPYFTDLAYAVEKDIASGVVTKHTLLECFGPPDLFDDGIYVYRFDHKNAGKNRDEWYFHLKDDKVISSAFNRCGINDLSSLKHRSQFPEV
jgi:hypothetical protein